MTAPTLDSRPLIADEISTWSALGERYTNWPVVYVLNGSKEVYVGETLNVSSRMRQHLANPDKSGLTQVRVVFDDEFNKSACLDLESFLIRMFAGDGRFMVLNRNDGIVDADYFDRAHYQEKFKKVFALLGPEGQKLFEHSIEAIENSNLFKLSPFKALTDEQMTVVSQILDGFFTDLEHECQEGGGAELDRPSSDPASTIVVQGDPGTGKTIVAIYIMKLLSDVQSFNPDSPSSNETNEDSAFERFFVPRISSLLEDFKIGFVIPQQSLRKSIQNVFKKTPGLSPEDVMGIFDVGASSTHYDLLIVDEAHRLMRRASQASGQKNTQFREINEKLFGHDDFQLTQLDWLRAKSNHQILLIDPNQTVRPSDISRAEMTKVAEDADACGHLYHLVSQIRVRGGEEYVKEIREVLQGAAPHPIALGSYDFRVFDNFDAMRRSIIEMDGRYGMSRLVAGFAWPWRSKKDHSLWDIEIDSAHLQWNSHDTDWINSKGSLQEVGSIHTVQGYDLNYAGVIIGPDLRYDPAEDRLVFDRSHYFDRKGKENIPKLGLTFTDEDLLAYVENIYSVLLTRGMRGTFVYAVDKPLRERLKQVTAAAA